jgi:lipopolysaccharide biosynthesis glycosyltransferase
MFLLSGVAFVETVNAGKNVEKQQSIPIFLASDDGYAPYVSVVMTSMLYNTNSFVEFYIIDSGISKINKKRLESLSEKFSNFSIEFISVDKQKIFGDFVVVAEHFPLEIYFRFLSPILKPNINKLIYLDSDTVLLDDIAELYNEDLDGHIIGAALEDFSSSDRSAKRFDISDEYGYFNSGVLLIDAKKWRENNITEELFETEEKYKNHLAYPDQEVLNKVFNKRGFKILNKKYNDFSMQCNALPIVKHFVGGQKPLASHNYSLKYVEKTASKCFDYFWLYAEETPFYETLLRNLLFDISGRDGFYISEILSRTSINTRRMINNQMQKKYVDGVFYVVIFLVSMLSLIFVSIEKRKLKQPFSKDKKSHRK